MSLSAHAQASPFKLIPHTLPSLLLVGQHLTLLLPIKSTWVCWLEVRVSLLVFSAKEQHRPQKDPFPNIFHLFYFLRSQNHIGFKVNQFILMFSFLALLYLFLKLTDIILPSLFFGSHCPQLNAYCDSLKQLLYLCKARILRILQQFLHVPFTKLAIHLLIDFSCILQTKHIWWYCVDM